jgi:hypothetical protein
MIIISCTSKPAGRGIKAERRPESPNIPRRVRRRGDAGSSFKTILFVAKIQNKADSREPGGVKAFEFPLFRPSRPLLSCSTPDPDPIAGRHSGRRAFG